MNTTVKTEPQQLLIAREDYDILKDYASGATGAGSFDKKNAAMLQAELKKAKIVLRKDLPTGVIGLNSRVVIRDSGRDSLIELVLVMPENAAIKEKRISIFAPIGTALLGARQGEEVEWEVPSGSKKFTIVEVHNQQHIIAH